MLVTTTRFRMALSINLVEVFKGVEADGLEIHYRYMNMAGLVVRRMWLTHSRANFEKRLIEQI